MDNNDIQLIGGPCGQHGPYTFYKAFKYSKNGISRVVTLSEFFFVKLWVDSDLVCIGELQLLWVDKNSEQVLSSLRLYFLPEHTPEGRTDHGEDEVLSISEKVVLRVEDLITWITVDAEWTWGRLAKCEKDLPDLKKSENDDIKPLLPLEGSLDLSDVEKEKKLLDSNCNINSTSVIVLSYPRYCRYRAIMAGIEGLGKDNVQQKVLRALGGFIVNTDNTRVLFCRDSFEYPELEGHELLCNHLAPKLKGRPRGKRKKRRSISPGSESNESESSISNVFSSSKSKDILDSAGPSTSSANTRRSTRSTENSESKVFIKNLNIFMKAKQTPIVRIPTLGYKELDLYALYTKVQRLGGYDSVTANRLWKSIFDDLSGNHNSTSAATIIRRHYERFLLSYERYEKGEEHKPLPVSERRRLKSKQGSSSASDAETSESTSRSGNTTPVPGSNNNTQNNNDIKDSPTDTKIKLELKSSALRSVRVKPERSILKEQSKSISEKPSLDGDDSFTKQEVKQEEQEDTPEDTKPSLPVTNLTEKNSEPLTTAIAPVQKSNPEKPASPVEGKENVPILNANEASNAETNDDDLIEVPYKAKTPEVIDLESETYKSITTNSLQNNSVLGEVKKKKLDILKEGGLEVTPVKPFAMPAPPVDSRPSVIQPTLSSLQLGNVTVTADKRSMPPPHINPPNSKRTNNTTKSNKTSPVQKNNMFPYVNGSAPPKVLQSNSIYSPSETVVYGDPKAPINFDTNKLHTSEALDLTLKNPQKPILEIVRVPNVPLIPPPAHNSHSNMHRNNSVPLLDGRKVGSNLEITLVNPAKNPPMMPYPPYPTSIPTSSKHYNTSFKYPQKRSLNENIPIPKIPRLDENGRGRLPSSMYGYSSKENGNNLELSIPQPFNHKNGPNKMDTHNKPKLSPQVPNVKNNYPSSAPNMFANYFPQMQQSPDKNVSPYPPPTLDLLNQLYALQNLYPPNHLAAVPPLLPTPEQIQFYTELLAHTSRVRFPFPFPQDSVNSSSMNNGKKQ